VIAEHAPGLVHGGGVVGQAVGVDTASDGVFFAAILGTVVPFARTEQG
jgi:hypothetical protein